MEPVVKIINIREREKSQLRKGKEGREKIGKSRRWDEELENAKGKGENCC